MSSAALAKKRRANEPPPPVPTRQAPQDVKQPMTGLTLPQVIAVIDSRLTGLEKGLRDREIENRLNALEQEPETKISSDLDELLQDFHGRFALLATQITDLKDIVMKLQSYTMDVNKLLLEQRSEENEKSAEI
jgi:uncharacterized protein (DUF342 family)